MTLWKRHTMETVKRSVVASDWEVGRDAQLEHRAFVVQWKYGLRPWRCVQVRIHLPRSIDHTTPRMDLNVSQGLWWWRGVSVCSLVVTDVHSGVRCWQWGRQCMCEGRGMWEISVPFFLCCCEPKTALKKLSLKADIYGMRPKMF